MDYLQMLYAVTIADSASMTKAAEKLSLSQSTLSLSYRRLEEELGVTLFRKEGRRLVLTPEGKLFCEEAREILERVDALKQHMAALGSEKNRTIVLCTEAIDFSNEAIKLFSTAYQDITIRQIQGTISEIKDMLHSGQVEIAVTLSDLTDDTVTSSLLLDEPMYVMLPPSMAQEDPGGISMKELAGLPLVTQTEGYGISSLVRSFYERAGIRPGKVREVREQENITIQTINDYGVGFLPESVANSTVPRAMFRAVDSSPLPVTEDYCRRQVYLTTVNTSRNSTPASGLLAFFRDFGHFASEYRRYPDPEEVTVAGNYILKL